MDRDMEKMDKAKQLTDSMANYKFWVAVVAGIGLVGTFYIKGKPESLSGPECTLTVHAELPPSADSETISIEVRKSGGFGWLHDRLLTSGTLELNGGKRAGKLELKMPGSGNVVYVVKGTVRLTVEGTSVTGTTQEKEQPLRFKGNTDLYLIHHAPGGQVTAAFTFHESLTTERPAGGDAFAGLELTHPARVAGNPGVQQGQCLLTLISPTPAPVNMKSQVFIDDAPAGEWPAGGKEMQLTVNQGQRNVRIVAGGKILVFHRIVNVEGTRMNYTLP